MQCDICDLEVANSEELKLHKERVHPIDERTDEELEKPDQMDEDTAKPEPEPITPGVVMPR